MSERVVIFDTTLRDGEQSAGVCFSVLDKLEIASQLAAMGVDVIEAGFPAASAGEHKAVTAVAREIGDAIVCALARAVPEDVDAAAEALAQAVRPRIHVFVNSSDVHLRRQLRKSRREVIGMVEACVSLARNATDDVEFSPMDATRADADFLAEVTRTALAAGATTINLPDTVGCILPGQLRERIRVLYQQVPELEGAVLSFHGQDDLGLATANAIAAVEEGARQLEVAVNGIGERAGNTSFEEVLMTLRVHGAVLGVHSGVDVSGIYRVSRCVEERSGMPVPPNKAIVGRNAFRHASGIHQDGVIKWRENYEVIDPATIGHPTGTEIVLGKLSGRAGFAERARQLGISLGGAALDEAFRRFQAVADGQSEVADDEVLSICQNGAGATARCAEEEDRHWTR
ncbi:MAG: 2-isopropylmalate synthase [Myxococcota bacterium]